VANDVGDNRQSVRLGLCMDKKPHSSPARDLRASQSVHGAPASAALPTGVVCPQPRCQLRVIPQYGIKRPNYPCHPSEEIAIRFILVPAPYSDVP
jgi:hypothetical protein